MTEKRLYTRSEAASYLALSERQLDRLVRTAEILAVRDGRTVKFNRAELDRYADSLPSLEPNRASA